VVDLTVLTIDNAYRTDSIWIDSSVIGIDHWKVCLDLMYPLLDTFTRVAAKRLATWTFALP
jgi:hypothetical protein